MTSVFLNLRILIFFGVTIATNWVRKKNACQSPSINPVFGRPLDLSETELLICKTGQKMPTIYFQSIIMRTKKKKNVCETDVKTVNHSINVKDYCGSLTIYIVLGPQIFLCKPGFFSSFRF